MATVNWSHPLLSGALDVIWSGAGAVIPYGSNPISTAYSAHANALGSGDTSSGYKLPGVPAFASHSGDMTITFLAVADTANNGFLTGYDYYDGSYGSFNISINERRTGGYQQQGCFGINFLPTRTGYADAVSIGSPYLASSSDKPFYNTGVPSCVSVAFLGASSSDLRVVVNGTLDASGYERVNTLPSSNNTTGQSGLGLGGLYNAAANTMNGANGSGKIILMIVHGRKLTQAEQESLTANPWQVFNGISGNFSPTFSGPNISAQSGTVGSALTGNDIASKFSDTDALTFSAVGSWPPGVTVSSAGVISGTPTTAGTYAGLAIRATDTAAQTVDSNTFSFIINAAGSTNAAAPGATITGTSTISGGSSTGGGAPSGTFSFDACENNTQSGILNNVAVNWTWLGGTVGAITSITNGSGTMTTSGMTISGVPTGAGCGIIRTTDGTVVAYQEGTVS